MALTLISFGARIGICSNDVSILGRLRASLPLHATGDFGEDVDVVYWLGVGEDDRSGSRQFELRRRGSTQRWDAADVQGVLDALRADIHFQVALHARSALFVHAGVVGWRGRAIVIPGRSMSGKSTLVAALVRAGAEYYSDEFAPIDARGLVRPYPKPLSLRDAGCRTLTISPEAMGGRVGTAPLPAGMIVSTSYRPDARWRPRRLTAGQAALALIDNTVLAKARPEDTVETMARVASQAVGLRGARGEAGDIAFALLAVLDDLPPSADVP